MILRTPQGPRKLRMAQFGDGHPIPLPSQARGVWSASGKLVSPETAMGLPAAMAAIRLLAETLGSFPLVVVEGDTDDKQKRPDTPQWELLHDQPSPNQTPFEAWSFAMASIQGWGGGFLLKGKGMLQGSRTVLSLDAMDPARVAPKVKDGELLFDVAQRDGRRETLSRRDVLYIPGLLVGHPLIGVSPITAHREALGGALALEEYGNRFFSNSAVPSMAIKSQAATRQQRQEAKESWENAHRGQFQQGTAVLPPGWEIEKIGVSPQDAQFVEGQKWSVDQAARVFKIVPAVMIGGTDTASRITPEQRNQDFLQFTMTPQMVRVEQRLHADNDLFPDKGLRPMFLPDSLLRADMKTRFEAYTLARQAGWLSVNDIRLREGLAPIEGGDDYQQTPVGGAPNLQPAKPDPEEDA